MNGYRKFGNTVVYRHSPSDPWRGYYEHTPKRKYSRPADWLRDAEIMMGPNNQQDCLWRKVEEFTRRMIWC